MRTRGHINIHKNGHIGTFSNGGVSDNYEHSPLNISMLSDWFDHTDEDTLTLVGSNITQIDSKGPSGNSFTQPDVSRQYVREDDIENGLSGSAHFWTRCMADFTNSETLSWTPGVDEWSFGVIAKNTLDPSWQSGSHMGKCGSTVGTKQYQGSLTGNDSMDVVVGGVNDSPEITRTALYFYLWTVGATSCSHYFNGTLVDSFDIGTGDINVYPTLSARRNDANDDYGFIQQLGWSFEHLYYNKKLSSGEVKYLYDSYMVNKYGIT